jgi:hypothetical protein
MLEDKMMEQKSTAQSKHVFRMLEIMGQRPFAKQIRSEECGCCTCAFAEELLSKILDVQESVFAFELQQNCLSQFAKFRHLPRFTLKILLSSLKYLNNDIDARTKAGDTGVASSHQPIVEAIRTLSTKAEEYYAGAHWLWFCRIAEPILQISEAYDALCKKGGIQETQRADIKMIETLKTEFEKKELKDKEFPELDKQIEKRKNKRVWSGGVCKLSTKEGATPTKTVDPLERLIKYCEKISPIIESKESREPLFKIWNFSSKAMLVFSKHAIGTDSLYFDIYFNSIDLPFKAQASLGQEISDFKTNNNHRKIFMEKYGIKHCYILNFVDIPEPKYYFLSLCRDLHEQQREWDADAFGAMFCGAYWDKVL